MNASDKVKAVSNSLVGGNVVAMVLRQAIRAKALQAGTRFRARQAGLSELNPQYTQKIPYIADIPVTTRLQETYTYQADITSHAVESGALFNDHIILHPVRIDLSFEVGNWEQGWAEYALDLLESTWRERIPVELVTQHRKLPAMLITSLQADNSVPEWGKLAFRASFQEIRLVTLQATKYPESKVRPAPTTGGPDVSKSIESPTNNGQVAVRDSGAVSLVKGLFSK